MSPDVEQAGRFLELLQPEGVLTHSFCWFNAPEAPGVEGYPKVAFGALPDEWPRLMVQNMLGARLYVAINEITPTWDTKGRATYAQAAAPVLRIRSVFGDFDDPRKPLPAFDLAPSIIVMTSEGKHHAHWLIDPADPLPVQEFQTVQLGIISRYKANGSDRSILAPNHLMRLPGSLHWKTGVPHLVTIVDAPGHRYSAQQLRQAFPYRARNKIDAPPTWDGVIPDDLVLVDRYVRAVYVQREDGGFNVDCPWTDQHSPEKSSASATTWWPPSENNIGRGGFHCFHSHCASRGADDYARAIRAHLKART